MLTNSADNVLRIYNLPAELYAEEWGAIGEMVRGGEGQGGDVELSLSLGRSPSSASDALKPCSSG